MISTDKALVMVAEVVMVVIVVMVHLEEINITTMQGMLVTM